MGFWDDLLNPPRPKRQPSPGDIAFPPAFVARQQHTTVKSSAIPPDGSITTAKLADSALSADATGRLKMADGFVNTAKLAAGAVDASKVAADVATQAELDAHAALSKDAAHPGTLSGSNVQTLSVGANAGVIPSTGVADAHVSATAALAGSKLQALSVGANAGVIPSTGIADAHVAAGAAIAESKLSLASDAAAGTASRRTLGTGATQAAAGNHTHTLAGDVSGDVGSTAIATGKRVCLIAGSMQTSANNATDYAHPTRHMSGNTAEDTVMRMLISRACTIRRLRTVAGSGLGAGASVTLTVRKNGVDTALSIAMNGAYSSGDTFSDDDSVSVAAGDYLTMKLANSGAGSGSLVAFTFEVEF